MKFTKGEKKFRVTYNTGNTVIGIMMKEEAKQANWSKKNNDDDIGSRHSSTTDSNLYYKSDGGRKY